MAKNINTKKSSSDPYKSNFAECLFIISRRFSLAKAFDDFLTLSIAACTQNLETKLSYYEDEYLQTIAPYKDLEERHEFSKAFSYLIIEMEERVTSSEGNDVLGEFFEQNISNGRNGQFFTPYHICHMMATLTYSGKTEDREKELRILDPTCGSGRMLLASRQVYGTSHLYYGIDIDRICIKMAALNLFLNGMWDSEVMCANSLMPDDFIISYRISLFPLGIFKVEEKEQSLLWQMHKHSFTTGGEKKNTQTVVTIPKDFIESSRNNSTQLDLF